MALRISRLGPVLIATLTVAAAVVVIVIETSIANAVASRWIRRDKFPDTAVGAAVITSASVNPNATMSSEALDHLLTGLELIRSGRAIALVTTTIEQQFPGGLVSSRVDQSRIVALFGSDTRWLQTPASKSTRDEAVKVAELLLPLGIRRISVVATPMHTRRACSAFEAVGFEVTCIPALVRSPGGQDPGPWPADRLRVFGEWVYEVVATLNYRSRGWLSNGAAAQSAATR